MAKFKLHAPYKPAGDQPKAIRELVENLRRGVKYQVLLGVTGSGKSVTPDEPVFVLKNGVLRLVPIGQFVDGTFGISEQVRDSVELQLDEAEIQTVSFDPNSVRMHLEGAPPPHHRFRCVKALVRHRSPSEIFEVRTVSGRVVKVTGDHSLWVVKPPKTSRGKPTFKLIKTHALKPGMALPVINTIPNPPQFIDHINLLEYMDESWDNIYVDLSHLVGKVEREKFIRALKPFYRNPTNAHNHLHRRRVRAGVLRRLANILKFSRFEDIFEVEEGQAISWEAVNFGSSKASIPVKLRITDGLMRFFGFYIAIGRVAGKGVNFEVSKSVEPSEIANSLVHEAKSFGLHVQKGEKSLRISSVAWAKLLGELMGTCFGKKHLPDFWPSLSDRHLREMLSAVFRASAQKDDKSVRITVKSPRLASDIVLALKRFGIASKISWSRVRKGPLRADRRLKSTVEIDTSDSLYRFEKVFGSVEPGFTGELFEIAASGRFLDKSHVPANQSLESNGAYESDIVFDIVKSVRKVKSDFKFVYDFAVEEDETFAAGLGGLFVHNTFTIANVIEQIGKPTLVISHNKTLAAQLYGELKSFFPENAVEFFISYYDYYQPEAYIPETDTYIEKDADINEDIERLRLRATTSLMERDDVIIVASVSAIYGLGDPEDVRRLFILVEVGQELSRDELIQRLIDIQYTRNDIELKRGTFRVRGDVVDLVPAYEEHIVRIEFFGDFVDSIRVIHPVTGKTIEVKNRVAIYPAGHWVTTKPKLEAAIRSIEEELEERLRELRAQGKLLEAQRLEQRTRFDLQMLREIGYCKGIENYSRHLSGRPPGVRPACLIDYFPKDFLMIIDESHVTIPQLRGMYHGDRSRKLTLVEYGFRLPSALDNRPLKFEELEELWNQVIFVSATPGPYELEKSGGLVVEQIIRPTGLVDPKITVKPTKNQIDVMIDEISKRVERNERVLITTLTKRTAEELADYLSQVGFRVRYLHSEIDAIERVEILRGLRLGDFDVLVGVNLLREGLDLPEVSLVIITDADKTGFLRSETSLIQVAGRAARNAAGEVLMFADEITPAMKRAIEETERRRRIQMEYNRKHGITPKTIRKSVKEIKLTTRVADERILGREDIREVKIEIEQLKRSMGKFELIEELERRMQIAASLLEFEKAAVYRDALMELKGIKRSAKRTHRYRQITSKD